MQKKIKIIGVNNLLLDVENARYGGIVVESQREAISKMLHIKDMSNKIFKLAAHIAENGLDPTELLLVIPIKPKKGSVLNYLVAEGNRRLLAIKLLHNPGLSSTDSYRTKIEKLTSAKIKRSLSKIECSVMPDRDAADPWVDLKHTGFNEGIGRVDWDGRARDSFRARRGKTKSVGRQILDYIESDRGFSGEIRSNVGQVDITNLTRLFQGGPAKNAFGLVQKNGFLESAIPLNELREVVEHVISIMLQEDVKVKQIYHKADQEKFIKDKVPNSILPSPENKLPDDQTWQLSNFDSSSLSKNQKQGSKPKKKKSKASVKSKSLSKKRRHIIDFSLKISDKRINSIYSELKNELNVHGAPNAVSVLFRVFLELTCDFYISNKKPVRSDSKKRLKHDEKLRVKVEHIAGDLEKNNFLSKIEAKNIRKCASSKNELTSVDSLNGYVHASGLSPIPTELNILMDNWQPFFVAVWK